MQGTRSHLSNPYARGTRVQRRITVLLATLLTRRSAPSYHRHRRLAPHERLLDPYHGLARPLGPHRSTSPLPRSPCLPTAMLHHAQQSSVGQRPGHWGPRNCPGSRGSTWPAFPVLSSIPATSEQPHLPRVGAGRLPPRTPRYVHHTRLKGGWPRVSPTPSSRGTQHR